MREHDLDEVFEAASRAFKADDRLRSIEFVVAGTTLRFHRGEVGQAEVVR